MIASGAVGSGGVNFMPDHLPREQILQFMIFYGTRGLGGWDPPTREVREARRLRVTRRGAPRDHRPASP
jgi:hypothetical protein